MTAELAALLLPDAWEQQPNGCWRWAKGASGHGYGYAVVAGTAWPVHRLIYMLTYGPLGPDLDVDHVCHNEDESCAGGRACAHRRCVNPDHLRAVPRRDNLLGSGLTFTAINSQKTHCPQGHPYDEANTARYGGRRQCIACRTERNRAYQADMRARRARLRASA